MKERRKPMRWRKVSQPRRELTFELWQDGKELATCQRSDRGWFWYGQGRNTAELSIYHLRLESCQAECMAWVRQQQGGAR